jgi:hypothetical protein
MQIAELWVQNDIAMAGCQNWVCRCDDNEAICPLPDLLIDKLPAEEPAAPALSLLQI